MPKQIEPPKSIESHVNKTAYAIADAMTTDFNEMSQEERKEYLVGTLFTLFLDSEWATIAKELRTAAEATASCVL
jgi:hypothetical protein